MLPSTFSARVFAWSKNIPTISPSKTTSPAEVLVLLFRLSTRNIRYEFTEILLEAFWLAPFCNSAFPVLLSSFQIYVESTSTFEIKSPLETETFNSSTAKPKSEPTVA